MTPTRVLIAGVSTRGFAESAARAGYDVVAVDGFGDLDLRARCREVAVARTPRGRFSVALAVQQGRFVACDAVAYVASFENHPRAVRALAHGRPLWGNPPALLPRARDPMRALSTINHAFPLTFSGPTTGEPLDFRWLLKPRASGGGRGVRLYRAGEPVPKGWYLQQQVVGAPGSIVFVAAGGRAVPLGISRMLVGDPAFGVEGFRYCGSILASAGDRIAHELFDPCEQAWRIANAAAAAFGLVGLNGIDLIAERGKYWYPVDVNPRYTASMELVERAYGISIFETHARACAGALPRFDLEAARRRPDAVGKAIVYAQGDVQVGDTSAWLEDDDIRDIPVPGQRIARGQPVCTVFASGKDQQSCYAGLVQRARGIYHALQAPLMGSA